MPILKTMTMPNHGVSEFHFVRRYEASFLDSKASATVLSYANEAAFISGSGPIWNTPVAIPTSVCDSVSSNLINTLEVWLTNTEVDGNPFINGVIVADNSQTLQTIQERTWDKIKVKRSFYEYNGFYTPLGRFDSNEESMRRISASTTSAMVAKSNGETFLIEWTLSNNSVVSLDADQMISVGVAAVRHVTETHDFARMLRTLIDNATTVEELKSVEDKIWPSVMLG